MARPCVIWLVLTSGSTASIYNIRFFVPGSASELNDKFYISNIEVVKQ
jgi:hypothetical protein